MIVNIGLKGVREAVDTVTGLVVPWRRKNAQSVSRLENALRQAQIDRIKADTLMARVKVEREQAGVHTDLSQSELLRSQATKTEAEAALLLAEAEKKHAEAERERAALRHSQIGLAMTIVDRWAKDIDSAKKMDYVIQLLRVIEQLCIAKPEPRIHLPSGGRGEE